MRGRTHLITNVKPNSSPHLPNACHPQPTRANQKSWLFLTARFVNLGSSMRFLLFIPPSISGQSLSPVKFTHEKFPLSVLFLHLHCHCSCPRPCDLDHCHKLLTDLPVPFSPLPNPVLFIPLDTFALGSPFLLCFLFSSLKILNYSLFPAIFNLPCQVEKGISLFCVTISGRNRASRQKIQEGLFQLIKGSP